MSAFLGLLGLVLSQSLPVWSAETWVSTDIGAAREGQTVHVPDGVNLSNLGRDLGGTNDEFRFHYQERTGDFDLRVRVEDVSITDPYVQAGLVARGTIETNASFAGTFASSAQLGCFFEHRSAAGANTALTAPTGGYPVSYPDTWLRLRRRGDEFSGFASFDGQSWQPLHTATVPLPPTVLLGFALASHDTNAVATAHFRDFGSVVDPKETVWIPPNEPLGPSNRRTGLVFSEIMYHPPDPGGADGESLEFIEVYNGESIFVDLTGWRLTGAVTYEFPRGYRLEAGAFCVIAAAPAVLEAATGTHGVLGPYTGRLNNAGDTLRLVNAAHAIRLEVEYAPEAPWPVAADGAGHSLVLARPSYGEDDARAWSASARIGGSPGRIEPSTPHQWTGIRINEILAHTDAPVRDFIELHNASSVSVELSGCFLSDAISTNKFRIPDGTTLPAGGWLSFDELQLGFSLNAIGETIYLVAADQSRVLDAFRFGGQDNGVSFGRSPDGSPTLRRLQSPTPGQRNAAWKLDHIVLNEIMYHPISNDDDDQYVEIHNASPAPIDLSGWRFTAGIEFHFPQAAVVTAGGYVVVAREIERLRQRHPHLNAANSFGNFTGSLSRTGERVALAKPDTAVSTNAAGLITTNTLFIEVSEVTYRDGGRWPELADGGGSSLERIDPRADGLRASNWAASDESTKAPWTLVETTGRVDLPNTTHPANRFYIAMLGAGECLIDDIELFRVGSTNLLTNGQFENGTNGWRFFGHHQLSRLAVTGAYAGQGALHVRAPGDGDTANNAIRANLGSTVASGQTVTLRARVRWLAGWPEVLLRVRGNGIELPARMVLPPNLGSPGRVNSRQIPNAGPAIFDVTHNPPLPRAGQPVLVTARFTDPDGIAPPRLRFRIDPATTLSTVVMRDDGTAGDALAGDGIYTAQISGQPARTLIAFHIEASDEAATAATSVHPHDAPARECLIRWDDPVPFGTLAHYHLWQTAATERARSQTRDLDNTYRDCTLVYGNHRVIYNAGFRDKGSPFHGGGGDFAITVPRDEWLLGSEDRVFGSTGNGGNESTGMRGDVSAWIGQQLGIPYLHSHYLRLFLNGNRFREVLYDLEQPSRSYARSWFGDGDPDDDLFKIALWFEFDDGNANFGTVGASLERFVSDGKLKLGRYRWNWQPRPSGNTANDYNAIFNLVTAINSSTERTRGLLHLADIDQWMRVFAFNRILGNWDSYGFSLGQNMYLFAPLGRPAVLLPWDIDFVLGEGNGANDPLWGTGEPTINLLFNAPPYRRMLWRAYQDAIRGPMLAENYNPQVDARRSILLKNGVTGLSDPRPIRTYLEGRRAHIQRQLTAADTTSFAVTSPSGAEVATDLPVLTLSGTAPFAVESIEVNGVAYPITWTAFTAWRLGVPVGAALHTLQLTGRDRRGQLVPGAQTSLQVRYSGEVPQAKDWVSLHEIMYDAPEPDAEFVELYNRHSSVPFDLSQHRINGIDFTFPAGSVIAPNGYLVVAQRRAAFAASYGSTIPVAGEFSGRLDNNGETLRLLRPGPSVELDEVLDEVRYDSAWPWPAAARGLGASLQLIDPAQDNNRIGNWMAAAPDQPNRATPGRANANPQFLEPFPSLWLNELLPANATGARDNRGELAPWIELYNAGTQVLDLDGYSLSQDPSRLTQWTFPSGTRIRPGQFLVVWADGDPAQSTPDAPHTSFSLSPNLGTVVLARPQAGAAAALDAMAYRLTAPDRAYGSVPDGDPRRRRQLHQPTPGRANNPDSPQIPVVLNEWLASNQAVAADPADGDFDDWFELHNTGTTEVDLSGYYLTDSALDPTRFRIPDGTTLPPGGFRLIWADGEANQNQPGRDLHVDFRLPAGGGFIGLAGPDEVWIDRIEYGPQTADLIEGRLPDGAAPPFVGLPAPRPGLPISPSWRIAHRLSPQSNRPPSPRASRCASPFAPPTRIDLSKP